MSFIAGLTAFYMFRLYFNIFWGKEAKHEHTPHESPLTMSFPLIFLAVVTVGAGFIPFGHFVSSNGELYNIHLDTTVATVSVCIALFSIALATIFYLKPEQPIPNKLGKTFSGLHKAASHRFYVDEVYMFVTHKIIFRCISTPIAWFDRHVVDGFMDFLAWSTQETSYSIRGFQSGRVQQYAYTFLVGALVIIVALLLFI